jgi:hypothetical protein
MPSAARQDQGQYIEQSYFPDSNRFGPSGKQERARLPAVPITKNPYAASLDIDGDPQNIVRELRSSVNEDNRFNRQDAGARMMERVFTHQWVPAEMTKSIVEQQMNAADRLRSARDDYTASYRPDS